MVSGLVYFVNQKKHERQLGQSQAVRKDILKAMSSQAFMGREDLLVNKNDQLQV